MICENTHMLDRVNVMESSLDNYKPGDLCLDCKEQGVDNKLRFFYISLEEQVLKCESRTCLWPHNDEISSDEDESPAIAVFNNFISPPLPACNETANALPVTPPEKQCSLNDLRISPSSPSTKSKDEKRIKPISKSLSALYANECADTSVAEQSIDNFKWLNPNLSAEKQPEPGSNTNYDIPITEFDIEDILALPESSDNSSLDRQESLREIMELLAATGNETAKAFPVTPSRKQCSLNDLRVSPSSPSTKSKDEKRIKPISTSLPALYAMPSTSATPECADTAVAEQSIDNLKWLNPNLSAEKQPEPESSSNYDIPITELDIEDILALPESSDNSALDHQESLRDIIELLTASSPLKQPPSPAKTEIDKELIIEPASIIPRHGSSRSNIFVKPRKASTLTKKEKKPTRDNLNINVVLKSSNPTETEGDDSVSLIKDESEASSKANPSDMPGTDLTPFMAAINRQSENTRRKISNRRKHSFNRGNNPVGAAALKSLINDIESTRQAAAQQTKSVQK
ncbi:uncharacterized protein LOC115634114 [Scaptodrosophila lebanonensis]|uniref:Uncharacterized protein LOC115634114 n=1 Tax=Drosophila lebanonensis TaxID=7225 RepID=A0A6J2UJ56_DROLE|nr:uncharacterized protein LOC115634114 [Scaptodrosophila lebanonensis]